MFRRELVDKRHTMYLDIPELQKYFVWSKLKDEKLVKERNVSFEQAVFCIRNGGLLAVIDNPSFAHKEHRCFIVNINNYCYIVPFIVTEDLTILKSIIPSRKETRKYLRTSPDTGGNANNANA
jgi:uncharacterized DUF497 family protein